MEKLEIHCSSCDKDAQLIEFYCRTCQKAICRNCLLLKHISIGNQNDDVDTGVMEEKQELLAQYERKTINERMSVISLSHELKLVPEEKEEGQDYIGIKSLENQDKKVHHELIDIKNDF